MLLFSVLVGSSLSLPTLQRAERQYYQQQTYNQYNYQDWSSSSSPNVQINGNFNNDICNHQDKFFGDLLDLGKIRSTRWSLWWWRSFWREKWWWWYGNEHEY